MWQRLLAIGSVTCAFACGSASDQLGRSRNASAGGAGGAGLETTAGITELCPDGNAPDPLQAPDCPETMPVGGSCCPELGKLCFYPGDDTYRAVALCHDDPQHPPYWQQTLVIDRLVCDLAGSVTEIGKDALACAERQTKPCEPQGVTTPQELLGGQVDQLIESCGGLPDESAVQVNFSAGCATAIVASISGPDDNLALLTCVEQALAGLRFACADGLDCARDERSTLK